MINDRINRTDKIDSSNDYIIKSINKTSRYKGNRRRTNDRIYRKDRLGRNDRLDIKDRIEESND
jgi:hypothetical protein